MQCHYNQRDEGMDAEGRVMQGAIAEKSLTYNLLTTMNILFNFDVIYKGFK